MSAPAAAASTSNPAQDWIIASPDTNVRLCGQLLDAELTEGAKFQLTSLEDIHIEHAALVRVDSSANLQTLVCLNTGKPIFTLEIPLLPTNQTGYLDTFESNDNESSPSIASPVVISLHLPLISRESFQTLSESQFYSPTFKLLLEGKSFLPPRFDPDAEPETPLVGPLSGVLNSPTLQRVLVSPSLSPQRRAHSQTGSDQSVPPLSLGLPRNARTGSFNSSQQQSRSVSRPPAGLHALVPDDSAYPSLSAVLQHQVSLKAKSTAEEIMKLRKNHDAFLKRTRSELDVLLARIQSAGQQTTSSNGTGLTVKGFGVASSQTESSPNQSKSPAALPSGLRSSSASRERSQSRGRSTARPSEGAADIDEHWSQQIRSQDAENEERGRSRSRIRRKEEDSKSAAAGRSKSRARAVAAATERAIRESGTAVNHSNSGTTNLNSGKSKSIGMEIPASIEENSPDSAHKARAVPESKLSQRRGSGEADDDEKAMESFVPHSNALVAIAEDEELEIPGEEDEKKLASGAVTADPNLGADATFGSDEDSEEHEAPFEMDEDIDVQHIELDANNASTALFSPSMEKENPLPSQNLLAAATSPTAVPTTNSFRPASYRPSNLSSSYAGLLASSLANTNSAQTAAAATTSADRSHAFKQSPRKSAVSPQKPFTSPKLRPEEEIATSPEDSTHPTTTTAKEDALIRLAAIEREPDEQAKRDGERVLNSVLGLDAPSHRQPLPRRRRSSRRKKAEGENSSEEEDENLDQEFQELLTPKFSASSKFAVGSLPISIGFSRARGAGAGYTNTISDERELQRKTSVPSAGMFVPPLLRNKSREAVYPKTNNLTEAVPLEITRSNVTPKRNSVVGASSLAQSLRTADQSGKSFSSRIQAEQGDERVSELSESVQRANGRGDCDDQESDGEEDPNEFVPPHLLVNNRRTEEEFLSRSPDV